MYRADDPENRLLGVGFEGADTEVLISISEFKETGDLVRYGELIDPYEPAGKKTQKVKEEKKKGRPHVRHVNVNVKAAFRSRPRSRSRAGSRRRRLPSRGPLHL